jgi:hypothetical protein
MTADNEIYTQLDRITDHLATMTKQERIAWFCRSAYVQPLNFLREIDGTTYAVRAFFSENARENITEKVQRIILKKDDKSRGI